MIDVTVVLVNDGYASTAIAPLEVFSSAGVLPNTFAGREPLPRFRVTVASVDGEPVRSAHRLTVTPDRAIGAIDKTDLIIVSATGLDIDGAISDHRALPAWLRKWEQSGAYIAGAAQASHSSPKRASLMAGARPRTGVWPRSLRIATRP